MLRKEILIAILCVILVLALAPNSIFAETIPTDPNTTQTDGVTASSGETPVLVPTETPADTDGSAEEAGVTPDSWLYSLEKMIESVQVAVTFNPEGKAELLIEFANERLAEAEIMSLANQQDLMEEVLKAYTATINKANLQVMQMIEEGEATSAEEQAALAAGEESGGTVEDTASTETTEDPLTDDASTNLVIENLIAKIEVVQSDAEKIVLKLTGDFTEEQAEAVQNIIRAEVQNTIAVKAYAAARVAYTDAVKQFADARAELAQARVSGDDTAIQAALDKLAQAEQYKNDMQGLRKDVQKVKVDVMKDTKEVIKEQKQILKEQNNDADTSTSDTDVSDDTEVSAESDAGTGSIADEETIESQDTVKNGSENGKADGKGNKNSH